MPRIIIISSALMQPKQTLLECPSSRGFGRKGLLNPCPEPRRPFSILSPTKTTLPKAFLLCQWGKGGPGGQGSEEPIPEALDPSLRHLNRHSGGGKSEGHPPPTPQAGAGKPSWGGPRGDGPESGGCHPQPAYRTVHLLWGAPGPGYA